ncbi:MAG: chromosomal replication initiator protein DnaA [Chitinivibrionia bacterium]|nr:chromosomal replication initiator protein DnaA [Chitinivibrionia bacterium]
MSIALPSDEKERDRVWNDFLTCINTMVSKQTIETWFKPMRLLPSDGDCVAIECPSKFFIDWVEEHHRDKIMYAFRKALGFEPALRFVNGNESPDEILAKRTGVSQAQAPQQLRKKPHYKGDQLNPKYTFGEFVVGSNSRMTYAACLAVSEKPAVVYNPLFIYGGVGLGKTHLMQAIGHYVLENNLSHKVHYSSAETFMNELITAIRLGNSHEFRERYRTVDILLIDDVQFLAGKESTQEEFFHTFNSLHGSRKQIVVTSDRGLITDIQPPDYETRLAILRKKVEKDKVEIPDDVLALIADSVKSNIRELEGSLVKLLVHASVYKRDIELDMAKEVLKDFIKSSTKKISISTIQKVVAQHFRVPADAMKSKIRTAKYAFPRQVAIYLSRELTNCSLTQIGQRFGGRDHTTVIHACQKIRELLDRDVSLKATVRQLMKDLS